MRCSTATSVSRWRRRLRSWDSTGRRLTLSNDRAYEFVMSVATGALDEVATIAEQIADASEFR